MKNPLVAIALSWRRTVTTLVVLPMVVSLAVLAYAWPAARIAPRGLPVGVVGTAAAAGTGAAGQNPAEALEQAQPGGFDLHSYPDQASARSAIEHRDIYGAFVVARGGVTVLEATAAGTSVAQLLDAAGRGLAAHTGTGAGPAGSTVTTVDVVPVSADDPRGVVFSSSLLPLTICSIVIALVVTASGLLLPGWRRILALFAACAAAGLAVLLIAQGFLGALPHEHAATWAGLALTMLAIAAPAAGLVTLIGRRGIPLCAVVMVFLGNPFSGSTSAPELLPGAAGAIGRLLPPGAGANLLRGTAYFGGSGCAGPLAVLAVWSVLGLAAVAFGRPAGAGGGLRAAGRDEDVSRAAEASPAWPADRVRLS